MQTVKRDRVRSFVTTARCAVTSRPSRWCSCVPYCTRKQYIINSVRRRKWAVAKRVRYVKKVPTVTDDQLLHPLHVRECCVLWCVCVYTCSYCFQWFVNTLRQWPPPFRSAHRASYCNVHHHHHHQYTMAVPRRRRRCMLLLRW